VQRKKLGSPHGLGWQKVLQGPCTWALSLGKNARANGGKKKTSCVEGRNLGRMEEGGQKQVAGRLKRGTKKKAAKTEGVGHRGRAPTPLCNCPKKYGKDLEALISGSVPGR